MPANDFLDTNVLIYAVTRTDLRKQTLARDLLINTKACISTQVLLEATHVLVRKLGLRSREAAQLLRGYTSLQIIPTTLAVVEESWRLADRYQLRTYDASIVASAMSGKCSKLYTEDLQNGQRIESLKIVNPFA